MPHDLSSAWTTLHAASLSLGRIPTVLIVDDEPVTRLSLAARLSRMGVRVIEAASGLEGLAAIRRERPDLTIMDWMMPEMDGPTVCEAVRSDPHLQTSHIILMTSHDEPDQIAEGLARGADDFLSKSASKQEMLARVQSGLRSAALVRSIEDTRDALKHKQEELETELRSAALYVESLLPQAGEVAPGLQLSWVYRPSLALGGDLFNLARWDENSLYFYILDASGHGVSPALRAASFSTFLRPENLRHCIEANNPSCMLAEANRHYPMTPEGEYFTIWMGSLSLHDRTLRYATAGHGGALVQHRDGSIEWLTEPGLPLGLLPDTSYVLKTARLVPGDRVLLMSDGLYEAPSPAGEVWGLQRLGRILRDTVSRPLADVLPQLLAEAERWHGAASFPDDAALMGLECLG
ncbi:MAG: SpoIIE family protein phosphatase [Nitrospira sp.]|jgi:sigma-B regulation protein RsbU (phosphoserine phosphatase)|nr:SpoIIE family protein phosphatase [Nitrospira sp.]